MFGLAILTQTRSRESHAKFASTAAPPWALVQYASSHWERKAKSDRESPRDSVRVAGLRDSFK